MIAIDTLAYTKELIAGGFTEQQAETQANTLNKTLNTALKEEIATKSDIEKVEAKINLIEEKLSSEIRLTRWMVGFCISLLVVVIGLILAPYIK